MAINNNHVYIEEMVTKNTFKTSIDTLINAKNLFTVKETLKGVEGDIIKVNKYTYTGNVVDADTGTAVADEDRGKLTYTTEERRIKPYKHVYDIFDKEKRQNGDVIPFSAKGAAEAVWNKINADFYLELAKINKSSEYSTLDWDAIETALGELELEDYSNMFVLLSPKDYSAIKKSTKSLPTNNTDIVFKGQLMTIDGLSVVRSNKVKDGVAYIAHKETIVNEIKAEPSVSIDIYNELEKETFVTKFAGLVYLSDEKYAIKVCKALTDLTVSLTAGLGKVALAPQTAATGFKFMYKASETEPTRKRYIDEGTTGFTEFSSNTDVTCTTKQYVEVIKVKTSTGAIEGYGVASCTPN